MINKYEVVITGNGQERAKEIRNATNLSIGHILSSIKGDVPLLAYNDFDDSERESFSHYQTNDFNLLIHTIEILDQLGVCYVLSGAKDLEDLKQKYVLYQKVSVSIDMLEMLKEAFPTSPSWEKETEEGQKFYVEIDGQTFDADYALKNLHNQ